MRAPASGAAQGVAPPPIKMLLFCFASNESLSDFGCESALSGLWVVLMSLNNSCGDNPSLRLSPIYRVGGSGFVSKLQAAPSTTACRELGAVGRLLPLFARTPGAL